MATIASSLPEWYYDIHSRDLWAIWSKKAKEDGRLTKENAKVLEAAYAAFKAAALDQYPDQQYLRRWYAESKLWQNYIKLQSKDNSSTTATSSKTKDSTPKQKAAEENSLPIIPNEEMKGEEDHPAESLAESTIAVSNEESEDTDGKTDDQPEVLPNEGDEEIKNGETSQVEVKIVPNVEINESSQSSDSEDTESEVSGNEEPTRNSSWWGSLLGVFPNFSF
ncbi:hypothetical protein BKA64DRAFT_642648 [Cadophora sp. MPI-SDFR-AT-0126]|nr:hypothetical protein BKA64DRAFT_642648 [Leotiomycetes sp. MPI-SDFR-AT-0126]